MSSKAGNRNRAKYAVTFVETKTGTPLDVLEKFVEWTKEKNIKSYIEVSEMLRTTPNEANRLLCLAVLPDDIIIKRMKGLMNESFSEKDSGLPRDRRNSK